MGKKLPALQPQKVIRTLVRCGFYIHHTSGSHYILKKEKLRVTVPYHGKDLKPGTLRSIIEQAGLTVEEFLDLL
jgi:predicted RNA binding protein YcfA (HicA-like mRNA interferase family)